MISNPLIHQGKKLLSRAALGLAAAAFAVGGAAAQEDGEQPTPAVMAPLAPESLITDVTYADGRLIGVGERGHILISENGTKWQQVASPVDQMLTAVEFVDDQEGWIVGHSAIILHTTDGGKTWEVQNHNIGEQKTFLDVLFVDSEQGYAVGSFGLLMVTEDGGRTWTQQSVVGQKEFNIPHLNSITRAEDGSFYLAAEFGLVFRSDDQGETWQKFQTPYDGSFFEVLNPEPGQIVVGGLRGHAFFTRDGGESWTRIKAGADMQDSLYGGTVLESGETVLVGQNSAILTGSGDFEETHLFKRDSGNTLSDVIELQDGDVLVTDIEGAHVVSRSKILP